MNYRPGTVEYQIIDPTNAITFVGAPWSNEAGDDLPSFVPPGATPTP